MATLELRDREIMLARPADLAIRTVNACGLSVAEMRARIALGAAPAFLVTALMLVTVDPSTRGELGALIDPSNMEPIVDAIAPLYSEEEPADVGHAE